jgi:hypothetical protein
VSLTGIEEKIVPAGNSGRRGMFDIKGWQMWVKVLEVHVEQLFRPVAQHIEKTIETSLTRVRQSGS